MTTRKRTQKQRLAYCLVFVIAGGSMVYRVDAQARGSAAGAGKSAPAEATTAAPAKAAPPANVKFRPYDQMDQQLGMPANRIAIPTDWKADSRVFWNVKFRPYDQMDQQLGMPANRIAIPTDWKADSRVFWNLNAYYMPVHGHIRAEAPDGGSWVDIYGSEMFVWFDRAHEQGPWGVRDNSGAIHHPNISLPEALIRYVIAPNRRNVRNLRILGYRPVSNLPKAFSRLFLDGPPRAGNGICMRVQYELDGGPVDEEFYGFMPPTDAIPAQPAGMEYHSYLLLAHSIGAKSGKLESVRSLLGFI